MKKKMIFIREGIFILPDDFDMNHAKSRSLALKYISESKVKGSMEYSFSEEEENEIFEI